MRSRIGRALAVVSFGVIVTGCAGEGETVPTYGIDTVGGFVPTDGRFTFEAPITVQARDVWDSGWFDASTMTFAPAECREYATLVEMLLPTDDSTTGADGLAMTFGFAEGEDAVAEGLRYLYLTARTFGSPEAAAAHVLDLERAARTCADGYGYQGEGGQWIVNSISVTTTAMGGVPEVLVIDDGGVDVIDPEGTIVEAYAHYTHYVLARGNVVLVAAYTAEEPGAAESDAVELIEDFVGFLEGGV